MRLLITGSRGWHDEAAIEAVIVNQMRRDRHGDDPFVLIHGDAKSGADAIADRVGLRVGLVPGETLIRVPADWARYKAGAGPIRNQLMLDEHHPDEVAAFRATGKSNGTDDMIAKAKIAGVYVHTYFAPAFDA